MADDVVFLVPGRPPMRGKAEFAAAQKGALGQFSFDAMSEVKEIKMLGDWAYCWTQLTVVMTPSNGGPPITRSGPTLSILRKQRGAWAIVRDANMLAAPAAQLARLPPPIPCFPPRHYWALALA